MPWLALNLTAGLLFLKTPSAEAQTPAPPAATQPTKHATATAPAPAPLPRDEKLWRDTLAVEKTLLDADPFCSDNSAALDRRRLLLRKTQLYLRLYPGGPHRDEAIRLELKALFEIGVLSNGQFDPLREAVEEYLRTRPSDDAVAEAAWWKIQCNWHKRENAASQPASGPVSRANAELQAEYRRYLDAYPHSRHAPRLTAELFMAAEERGDAAEQRRLVARLEQEFPQHLVTKTLAAQIRRNDALGKPFRLAFQTGNGVEIDTCAWNGAPVLIVFWGGFSDTSREAVRAIEAFRAAHPDLHVAGVNLDETDERMRTACRDLEIDWPQYHDGLGWSGAYVRDWGVRFIPRIFAIDRAGRLAAICGETDWPNAADKLLAEK